MKKTKETKEQRNRREIMFRVYHEEDINREIRKFPFIHIPHVLDGYVTKCMRDNDSVEQVGSMLLFELEKALNRQGLSMGDLK